MLIRCIIKYWGNMSKHMKKSCVDLPQIGSKKELVAMNILKSASAGTLESSDAYVEIEPAANKLAVSVESVVEKQFGDKIRSAVMDVLAENDVKSASVRVIDRGALECVIRARVETAVLRAKGDN